MNKQEIRSIMSTVADMDMSEDDVIKFIVHLAQNQMYKPFQAFKNFCTNCAIYYTSSPKIITRKIKLGLTDDEIYQWEQDFIEKFSTMNLMKMLHKY